METEIDNNLYLARIITPRNYYNGGFIWIDISTNLEERTMGK